MRSVHPDLQALIDRRRRELGFAAERMSIRAVARRATERGHPISPETVRQLANGSHSGRVDDGTVDALAAALDVSRAELLRAMHETRSSSIGPWEPPEVAHRLSLRQRRALEELIAAMVSPRAAADEDRAVDLVAAGDQGMFVAQTTGSSALSEDDREANESILDEKLDRMERDARTRRRFGGS